MSSDDAAKLAKYRKLLAEGLIDEAEFQALTARLSIDIEGDRTVAANAQGTTPGSPLAAWTRSADTDAGPPGSACRSRPAPSLAGNARHCPQVGTLPAGWRTFADGRQLSRGDRRAYLSAAGHARRFNTSA